ncbi:DNA repair protein [Psychrobacter sp. AOP7-D1-15]|uniref:hypothetical protein n=1 Tax=unclassified Psychrobacter TaxID=196806 RepID=UPI001865DE71|nr:hypothetical protein [Psychrobacter sp. FME61]
MQKSPTKDFDWLGEVNKTVTHSLITTFGLDFLLLEDKKGGDVDTIHNVRNEVWATEKEKNKYDSQDKYSKEVSKKYHSDKNYIDRGRKDNKQQDSGGIKDIYTGKNLKSHQKRQLDHVISAHEIHDDAGRVLAGVDGVKIANEDSNFVSTAAYINVKKSDKPVEVFINELPSMIDNKKTSIANNRKKLETMPSNTPEQRHKKTVLEDKIKKEQAHVSDLENVDKQAMLKADQQARQNYDKEVGMAYYSSSKFLKGSATAAASKGALMGARQAVGLVLAEIWFELKEAIPNIYKKNCSSFVFSDFWDDVKSTLSDVLDRVKLRFKDVLNTFKDSFIGGVLASISTTLLNIVFTSGKLVGKLIRESWNNLVQAMKLVFFNPQKLEFGDLMREVTRIILASVSTIIGVAINQKLATILTVPFGTEIAAFISALFIGLFTVGTGYFLDHNPIMKKIWRFLNSLKGKYAATLEFMKEANAEIDQYVTELARIEFNLDANELQTLCDSLALSSSEFEKSIVLKNEIKRRNIELPYEMGNSESTKSWLKAKFNSKK